MKKQILLVTLIISLLFSNAFTQTVYITKTGKKYHRVDCKYLSKSSYSINLSDAKAKGYEPCKVCKPPTTVNSTTNQQTPAQTPKKETKNTKNSTQSVQCSAITKKGTQCKRMTKSPNGKCYQHGGD